MWEWIPAFAFLVCSPFADGPTVPQQSTAPTQHAPTQQAPSQVYPVPVTTYQGGVPVTTYLPGYTVAAVAYPAAKPAYQEPEGIVLHFKNDIAIKVFFAQEITDFPPDSHKAAPWNVSCKPIEHSLFASTLWHLEKELESYPANFLKSVDSIVLVDSLSLRGAESSGYYWESPTYPYIYPKSQPVETILNDGSIQQTTTWVTVIPPKKYNLVLGQWNWSTWIDPLHSQMQQILRLRMRELGPTFFTDWEQISGTNKYLNMDYVEAIAKGRLPKAQSHYGLADICDGFVNSYARANAEADFNSIGALLWAGDPVLWILRHCNSKLDAKMKKVVDVYTRMNPTLTWDFFDKLSTAKEEHNVLSPSNLPLNCMRLRSEKPTPIPNSQGIKDPVLVVVENGKCGMIEIPATASGSIPTVKGPIGTVIICCSKDDVLFAGKTAAPTPLKTEIIQGQPKK